VYSYKSNRYLSRRIYDGGYWGVNLRGVNGKNMYRNCHTLVAKAFLLDTYQKGLIVNHKDLDKSNCNVNNLEWITYKENSKHYVDNMPEHASDHKRDLALSVMEDICKLIEGGKSTLEIHTITGVSKNKISKLRTGVLYSWFTKDYNLQPEPTDNMTVIIAKQICDLLEYGFGCKFICDLYDIPDLINKKSVNNIKYRCSFENISKDYTWWVGKYISKSQRKKGITSKD